MPQISIVVPIYNEVDNILCVHGQISAVISKLNKSCEIIFVDDGSTDGTLEELKKLPLVRIASLNAHYGQSCALDAGIKMARGERIITMDGDGQNDPEDIPMLLKKLDEGYDVVCGWRHQRQDDALKCFISAGAAVLRKILVDDGVHDAGCTLRAYRPECFEKLDLHGGMHRMIPALLRWRGFKMTEIKVNHHCRMHGKSKHSWQRVIRGLMDMMHIWYWCQYKKMPKKAFASGNDDKILLTARLKAIVG